MGRMFLVSVVFTCARSAATFTTRSMSGKSSSAPSGVRVAVEGLSRDAEEHPANPPTRRVPGQCREAGRMLNVSSHAAVIGVPLPAAYASSQAAVRNQ